MASREVEFRESFGTALSQTFVLEENETTRENNS